MKDLTNVPGKYGQNAPKIHNDPAVIRVHLVIITLRSAGMAFAHVLAGNDLGARKAASMDRFSNLGHNTYG
jgi:hypothetical protein